MCGCGCTECKTATAYGFPVPHGGAVVATAMQSHPASLRGGVVPTGRTRQSPVTAYGRPFPLALNVENPGRNQAEVGTPRTSVWGQALIALVRGGKIVRNDAPIMPQTVGGFRGFVGNFAAAAARSVIVPKGTSYTGQLPLSEQPKVNKPRPWLDTFGLGARYTG